MSGRGDCGRFGPALALALAAGGAMPAGADPPARAPPVPAAAGHQRVLAASGNCGLDTNGDPDGVNGYSNQVFQVAGHRRTLLDDFLVPWARRG